MSIDSFGFQVMSLDELIQELQLVSDTRPELRQKPVWTRNMHPLHFPVKRVDFSDHGTQLVFERGGN